MKRVRLLYLTYNENLVGSGILRVQVRKMLESLTRLEGVEAIRLVSFISARLKSRQQVAFDQLAKVLSAQGIDLKLRLMPVATAWGWPAMLLMQPFCSGVLTHDIKEFRPTVVHSRGYAAGWLLDKASKSLHVPHVFDPRGSYPEEMVKNGQWSENGPSYRNWKTIEARLIRDSAVTVGVTPLFRDEFRHRGAPRSVFIPNRCDLASFPEPEVRISSREPLMVFTGEMDSNWYAPEFVGKHFLHLSQVVPALKLLVVTRKDPAFIREGFRKAGVPDDAWKSKGVRPEEVPEVLASASLGLMVQDYDNSWPVKFAEYLAAGIPVVLNRREESLMSSIVEKERLGVVVEADRPQTYAAILDVLDDLPAYRQRCRDFAVKHLGIELTAKQYLRLYRSVVGA